MSAIATPTFWGPPPSESAPTRNAHQAGRGLDHGIVTRFRGSTSLLAECRDRTVNKFGIRFAQARVIEPEALHRSRLKILDNDIGLRCQVAEYLCAFWILEIDRYRALVAISGQKIGRLALFVAQPWRSPLARIITSTRALDLYDVGTKITEQLGCPRACQHTRQIENFDTS